MALGLNFLKKPHARSENQSQAEHMACFNHSAAMRKIIVTLNTQRLLHALHKKHVRKRKHHLSITVLGGRLDLQLLFGSPRSSPEVFSGRNKDRTGESGEKGAYIKGRLLEYLRCAGASD